MQASRTLEAPASRAVVATIGLILIGAYVSIAMLLMDRTSFDVWGAFLLTPVLIGLSIPALRRHASREVDPGMFGIMLVALLLKLAGAAIRYFVAFTVYGGVADAARYHNEGVAFASSFRHLHFAGVHLVTGTPFMDVLTGVVYALIGTSKLGGFVFFSWLGFWGLFLFYRAFTIAVPLGRRRPYALLLFFLPSLVFWPSGIGKEAWMMFGIGIVAYGVAKMLTHATWRGLLICAVGLWAVGMVRPHMAALLAVSLAVAVITRKSQAELRELAPIVKGGAVVIVAILAVVLVVRTDRFLQGKGIDTTGGVHTTLSDVQGRTSEGGSSFASSIVDSPARAPLATVTVLFRPFIFEAQNMQSLLAAIEGTALMILCLFRGRWVWAAIRSLRRQPYVVFCLVYSSLFIVAYSGYANFGLLARQRVQLYPLFLVLISIPPISGRRGSSVRSTSVRQQQGRETLPA
jgi:hypothetical protein